MRRVLPLALLLAACGQTERDAKTYIGHNEAQLYGQWGAPTRSQPIAGGKVVAFDHHDRTGRIVCDTSFIVANNGTITSARSSCPN